MVEKWSVLGEVRVSEGKAGGIPGSSIRETVIPRIFTIMLVRERKGILLHLCGMIMVLRLKKNMH